MINNFLEQINSSKINEMGLQILQDHTNAIRLLYEEKSDLTPQDIFTLKQYQTALEFIPASNEFMRNVKRTFNDKQINFTIQNYITWHYIDSILLTFFRNTDRLNKFKACAVTEIDNIFIEGLEFMLSLKDKTMDEIRFNYLKFMGVKFLPHLYFYNKTDDEVANDLNKLYERGPNAQDIVTEYSLLLLLMQAPEYHFMLKLCLEQRKCKFGASPVKLNEQYFGNILYKGLTGQFKPLEKGEIIVKNISKIKDIEHYFANRQNAYKMLSKEGVIVNAAYINDTVVGVVGYENNTIINVHVDGDYRNKGVAKKLISSVLEKTDIVIVTPIGDSLDFIKRVSKYNNKKNIGVITKETLQGKCEKKDYPKGITIKDFNGNPLDIVSDTFKEYLVKNYDVDSLSVKEATIENNRIGYIIYDKANKKVAVIEMYDEYSNMGIGNMLLKSIIDYNVWSADIAKTGLAFWINKGIISGATVYFSKSDSKLHSFAKKNKIASTYPQFHIDL